jgi:hypothetical protein
MTIRFLGIWLLAVCCTRGDFVVAPSDRETQSGNTFTSDGFRSPSTFQNVYGARNFSGPVLIHGMAFRLEEGAGGLSFEAVIPRLVIRASTYSGSFTTFNGLSYEANKGIDDMTAFDSAMRWNATDLPGTSPNPFDLKIRFSQPFQYDPTKGALLIEYSASGQFTSGIAVDSHGHGDSSIGWIGGTATGNLVTEFDVTPIPEPHVALLGIAGVVALWLSRTRYQR